MVSWIGGYFKAIEGWFGAALDIIYPGSVGCPLCNSRDCQCRRIMLEKFSARQACLRCGKFGISSTICPECYLRGEGFPDRVLALAPYEGKVREGVHRLKYKGDRRVAQFFADLLLAGPGQELGKVDLIMPVPLHGSRLRERGFNQALLLAEHLSSSLGISLAKDTLIKQHQTQAQSGLNRRDRLNNLNNAFSLKGQVILKNKTILLVDDVITTGATLEACGLPLRAAGVTALKAICIAAGKR